MARQIEATRENKPSVLKRAAAGLVLIAVAALVIHVVFSVIVTVFWIALVVAVIVGAVWAFRTLF